MADTPIYQTMLSALTQTLPIAVLNVDSQGRITHTVNNRRVHKNINYFAGKSLGKLLRRVLGEEYRTLYDAYQACILSVEPIQIVRFEHNNVRDSIEYFDWRFIPEEGGSVNITITNVTEHVLLEQEFNAASEQSLELSREMHAAMSTLDLQLMDLDQAHKKLAALYRITSIVQRTVEERQVLNEIVEGLTTELGFSCAAVLLLDDTTKELVVKAQRGYPPNIRIPFGQGVTWHAALTRELVYVPDVKQDPRYIPATGDGQSEVAIPLLVADKLIGVLDIESSQDRSLHPYDLNLLRSLAGQAAVTIVHAQHVSSVEVQAITDGLTGLYNYRYFYNLFDREFKRADRYNHPLSMLMLDIDYFKRFNDTHGHVAGNDVLCQLAEILKRVCRDVDIIVRYGGEEFIILFPETTLPEACGVAERIRTTVANYAFPGRNTQPGGAITVSIGVAGYPYDARTAKELMEHADTALYMAKRATKNCVMKFPSAAFVG